jgi:hypothetical protein
MLIAFVVAICLAAFFLASTVPYALPIRDRHRGLHLFAP